MTEAEQMVRAMLNAAPNSKLERLAAKLDGEAQGHEARGEPLPDGLLALMSALHDEWQRRGAAKA